MKKPIILQGAVVVGDVSLEQEVSVWYNAVLRGDVAAITVKKGSNIQDNVAVHASEGYPVTVGEYVSVGHGAILHGCSVGDNSLIGMGAILLDGVVVGKNCIIGAGALLPKNTQIPDNSLVIGFPGTVKRSVTREEILRNQQNATHYILLSEQYREK